MTQRPEFDTELFAKGVQVRREVLGSAHVDRSLMSANDFTAPMQKIAEAFAQDTGHRAVLAFGATGSGIFNGAMDAIRSAMGG